MEHERRVSADAPCCLSPYYVRARLSSLSVDVSMNFTRDQAVDFCSLSAFGHHQPPSGKMSGGKKAYKRNEQKNSNRTQKQVANDQQNRVSSRVSRRTLPWIKEGQL